MSNDIGKFAFIGAVVSEPFQENDNGKPVLFAEISQGNNRLFCQLRGDYRIKSAGQLRRGDRVWGSGDISLETINGHTALSVVLDDIKPLDSKGGDGGWNGRGNGSYGNNGYGQRKGWGQGGNRSGNRGWGN